MFFCLVTASFPTNYFLLTPVLPTNHIQTLQAIHVQSHQRLYREVSSYRHMRCRGICHWLSGRSICRHWNCDAAVLPINSNIYTDQYEPIIIYHSMPLLVLIQLCSPHCWHLDSNYFRKGDVHAYDHAVIAEMSHYITQCFAIQLTHKRNYTIRLCYKCMNLIPIMFWTTMFYRVIHTGASDQNFLCMVYLRHWNYHYVFYRTLRFTQWNGCVILVLWNSLNTNIFHLLRGACMFWYWTASSFYQGFASYKWIWC